MPNGGYVKKLNRFIYANSKQLATWLFPFNLKAGPFRTVFFFSNLIIIAFALTTTSNQVQAQKRNLIEQILRQTSDSLLQQVVQQPAKYQVQILYT